MKVLLLALILFTSQVFAYDDKHFNPDLWPYIQERMFGVRTAVELDKNDELTISGPKRAASGAQVPITITVNTDRFVKLYLVIDANPIQHAATFKYQHVLEWKQIVMFVSLAKQLWVNCLHIGLVLELVVAVQATWMYMIQH